MDKEPLEMGMSNGSANAGNSTPGEGDSAKHTRVPVLVYHTY